jgi:hypothetical protein
MTLKRTDPLSAIRPLEYLNNSGALVVPAFGLLRIVSDNTGVLTMDQPNADSQSVYVNSPVAVQPSKNGSCSNDWPHYVQYNPADGTPAVGDVWGAAAGSYQLRKNNGQQGFRVAGTPRTIAGGTISIVMVEKVTPLPVTVANYVYVNPNGVAPFTDLLNTPNIVWYDCLLVTVSSAGAIATGTPAWGYCQQNSKTGSPATLPSYSLLNYKTYPAEEMPAGTADGSHAFRRQFWVEDADLTQTSVGAKFHANSTLFAGSGAVNFPGKVNVDYDPSAMISQPGNVGAATIKAVQGGIYSLLGTCQPTGGWTSDTFGLSIFLGPVGGGVAIASDRRQVVSLPGIDNPTLMVPCIQKLNLNDTVYLYGDAGVGTNGFLLSLAAQLIG